MNNLYTKLNKKYEDNIPIWIENSLKDIPEEWNQILFSKSSVKKLLNTFDKINNDINENKIELSPSEDNIFEFARLTPIKKNTYCYYRSRSISKS